MLFNFLFKTFKWVAIHSIYNYIAYAWNHTILKRTWGAYWIVFSKVHMRTCNSTWYLSCDRIVLNLIFLYWTQASFRIWFYFYACRHQRFCLLAQNLNFRGNSLICWTIISDKLFLYWIHFSRTHLGFHNYSCFISLIFNSPVLIILSLCSTLC